MTNTGTNQARKVESNEAGNYTVPFLIPGVYDIQAEAQGFKLATRRGVTLQVGAIARIDFALPLGSVSEAVEVTGGAPLLATESTALGTVIENKRIVDLPLNGRNYLQLVALSPNVTAEQPKGGFAGARQGGDRASQAFSIAGQRMVFNHFTLDGVENTDINFNTFIIRPSIDALQEFKAQTGIYSAEFGRATAQINVTTKPGSNKFHGALFEFLRNDVLDAREWRNAGRKNPFRRNQYGYTLGGRAIRDKLFFLSNYEGLRDRKAFQMLANNATDRMRSGDFSGQTRRIFDPASRTFAANGNAISATPFPGDRIPTARFHPIALKLLEFYPRPTVAGDEVLRNFVRNTTRPINMSQYTQRIDWNQNTNSNWFGRLSWGNEFVGEATAFPTQPSRTTTGVAQVMISNTRLISPSVVNEFRFGYNQFRNEILTFFANIRDVRKELNIIGIDDAGPSAWGGPTVGFENGLSGFGESANGPFINRNHTFQWIDNLSVVRGKHSFRFGGEFRRDRYNQLGNQFPRGTLGFESKATFDPANRTPTGHSFADFMLGEVRSASRALGLANIQFRASSFALYAEDSWRLTPKLTLNLGVRYENTPPWTDKNRGIMNVQLKGGILDPSAVPVLTRPGSGDFYEGIPFRFHDGLPTQAGDQFLGRSLIRRDNNDWAPRIGIAYTLTPKLVVRTGFGIFFAQDTGNPRFDMARNLAARDQYPSNEERPDSNLSDPWRAIRQSSVCRNFSGACFGPPVILGNSWDRKTPYVMQWMFNVQQQLANSLVLETGYQGSAGHQLERITNLNIAVLRTGLSDSRSVAQRRPWPAYGNIQTMGNLVDSNYHALSFKLTKQFTNGLTYLAGYTWSRSIDSGSGIREDPGDNLLPHDVYNLRGERALSQFHTGKRFVGSVIYELPFGPGKKFAKGGGVVGRIVGGWQVGSILTFSQGGPMNIGGIGDRQNIGYCGCRPDATGVSPKLDNPTVDRFWNLAAFNTTSPELAFRHGNIGRNVLLRPGYGQWDFSMVKNTTIREGHRLEFRYEAFNFSNHPNWNPPSSDPINPNVFGRVTSARTMRETQFGMKYIF